MACWGWTRWADALGTELVAGAQQRPLLSGYYRVAATAVTLADRGGAFGASVAVEVDGPVQHLGSFGQARTPHAAI